MRHESSSSKDQTWARFPQPIPGPSDSKVIVQRWTRWIVELECSCRAGLAVFDVPSSCPISLRGEPIKLRLIQPRDRVRVAFSRSSREADRAIAGGPPNRILVLPGRQGTATFLRSLQLLSAASGQLLSSDGQSLASVLRSLARDLPELRQRVKLRVNRSLKPRVCER